MADKVYIDTEELTSIANNLKSSGSDIYNEYNDTCYSALEQGKECLQLTNLDSTKFFDELKRIYTETQERINALGDFLLKTVIPKYIDTSDAIAKYFTIELGSEVAKLLGITAPALGSGAAVGAAVAGAVSGLSAGSTIKPGSQENPDDYEITAKSVMQQENFDFDKSDKFETTDGQVCGKFTTTNDKGEKVQGVYQLKDGVTEEDFSQMTDDEKAEAIEQMTVIEENSDGSATIVAVKGGDKNNSSAQVTVTEEGSIEEAQGYYQKGKTSAGAAYTTADDGTIKDSSSDKHTDGLFYDTNKETSITTNSDGSKTVTYTSGKGSINDDGSFTDSSTKTTTATVDSTGKVTGVTVTQENGSAGITHGGSSTAELTYEWMDSTNGNGNKVLIEVHRDSAGNITNQDKIDEVLGGSSKRQAMATTVNQSEMNQFANSAATAATTQATSIVDTAYSRSTGYNTSTGTAGNAHSDSGSYNDVRTAQSAVGSTLSAASSATRSAASSDTASASSTLGTAVTTAKSAASSAVSAVSSAASSAASAVSSAASSAASSVSSAVSSAASAAKQAVTSLFGKK